MDSHIAAVSLFDCLRGGGGGGIRCYLHNLKNNGLQKTKNQVINKHVEDSSLSFTAKTD